MNAERKWFIAAQVGWIAALIFGVGIGYGLRQPMVAYFVIIACLFPAGVWTIWYWRR